MGEREKLPEADYNNCIDTYDTQLEKLDSAQQDLFNSIWEPCIAKDSCSEFFDCVQAVSESAG